MNKRFEESPRFNAASLATGSILALIVAMTVSLVFDIEPADASTGTTIGYTVSAHA